jgi:hypothetical protein
MMSLPLFTYLKQCCPVSPRSFPRCRCRSVATRKVFIAVLCPGCPYQSRCGSRYVKPTKASQRVEVRVRPRLKPASKTRVFRAA